MKKILIIGGSGHAKVVISILQQLNEYEIVGYVDKINRGTVLNVSYLGDDRNAEDLLSQGVKFCALGIGKLDTNHFRKELYRYYLNLGFTFPPIISLKSNIDETVKIGQGTVVMPGVTINVDTIVGKICIINTNSSIDHDCNVNDDVHVAPGATICGNVKIAKNVFVGAGSVVVNNASIAENKFYKACSLIK